MSWEFSRHSAAGETTLMRLRHPMRNLLLLALTACNCPKVWALSPDSHLSQYAHQTWKIEEGFFGVATDAIAQDRDGYLWVGGEHGLYRFDGVRVLRWSPPSGMHLPSSEILSLLADESGGLWIGSAAGLSHWNRGHLENFLDRQGRVQHIVQDSRGDIWFSLVSFSDNEPRILCKVAGTSALCYGQKDGLPPEARHSATFARDEEGYFWIGTSTSLVRWKPGSVQVYSPDGLKSESGQMGIPGISFAENGSLLVGIDKRGRGLGLQRLTRGRWVTVVVPGFDGSSLKVRSLFSDLHGAVWIGTSDGGLYRLYQGKAEHFGSTDGLSSDHVNVIMEDREGTLWLTTSKGLDSFRDIPVLTVPASSFGGAHELDNVVTTRDGTLWIGGLGTLFTQKKGGDSFIQRAKNLGEKQVTTIFEDHRGRMWIGLDNTLNILEGNSFGPIHMTDGSPTGMIVSMADDQGQLWAVSLGPPRRIIRIDPNTGVASAVPNMPQTSKIAADPHAGLWLGLNNGDLVRYLDGKLSRYALQQGPNARIQMLKVTAQGDVLAAAPFGLIYWHAGIIRILDEQGGLPCSNINDFVEDLQGNLWLYMECGLAEVEAGELKKWRQEARYKVQPRVFDWADGIRIQFPPFEGSARSWDGRLWFNNQSALQVVDPSRLVQNKVLPPVHIENVVADHMGYSPRDSLRLPKRTHDLEIDYTALSLVAPQKVLFRYKLSAVDQNWQNVGTRRQAFYTNLAPGAYSFRVIACNNDGFWNEAGDAIQFIIPPMFYQTLWFRCCFVALIALLLYWLFLERLRISTRLVESRMRARALERERIARELHDTLLQGFQGVVLRLQRVSGMLSETDAARLALEETMDRADEVLIEGRSSVIDLRLGRNSSATLVEQMARITAEICKDHTAKCELRVEGQPREVRPAVLEEFLPIAKELIRNAQQHAAASTIVAEIRFGIRQLKLLCRDDGVGMPSDVLQHGEKPGRWGLIGIRERADRIRARLIFRRVEPNGTEAEVVVNSRFAYTGNLAERFRSAIPPRLDICISWFEQSWRKRFRRLG